MIRSAAGIESGEIDINLAGNSISSSLLPMLERHEQTAPVSVYSGVETVPIDRIDRLVKDHVAAASSPYLKIDTQGYESVVLQGATGILDAVTAIELEVSLVALYEGQELMEAMIRRLDGLGFRVACMESGFWDRTTGETLQVNCIFVRTPWGSL